MKNINRFLAKKKAEQIEKEIKTAEAFAFLFNDEDKEILNGKVNELKNEKQEILNHT